MINLLTKQYHLDQNILTLHVDKSSKFTVYTMYFFAFIIIVIPIVSFILSIVQGNKFHFGFLVGIIFSTYSGSKLLRIALWSQFGKEIIRFDDKQISYTADYGKFKDDVKTITNSHITYAIQAVVNDNKKGTLLISNGKEKIVSVANMPVIQLNELIILLQQMK